MNPELYDNKPENDGPYEVFDVAGFDPDDKYSYAPKATGTYAECARWIIRYYGILKAKDCFIYDARPQPVKTERPRWFGDY